MLYGSQRQDMREVFFAAWHKHIHALSLQGAEQTIVRVALEHPEYHAVLADPDTYGDRDYPPDQGRTNPFLHLGMHVAIEDQLAIDQPFGIRQRYQALLARVGDPHEAQHRLMDCLAEMLWRAQRDGTGPQETIYLACLDEILGGPPKVKIP
jgi:hypothetical protein